jgi:tetratricopeptide (TPR) repeat protein
LAPGVQSALWTPEAEGADRPGAPIIETTEEAFLLADQPERPVSFAPNALRAKILQTFRRFELTPLLDEALDLLRRVIDQQAGNAPEERLHLGLAHMLLGNYNKATTALEAALAQYPGEVYPAANYYLGRTLVEQQKDLGRAVELLRLASRHEPDNIAAYYYLGQALRMLVEQEILGEAEQALQTYLDLGAPLDHRAEVYGFLEQRRVGTAG